MLIRLFAASIFLWTAAVPDLRTKRIPVWIPAAFLPVAAAADLFGAFLPETGLFFCSPAASGLFPPAAVGRRELFAGAVPGLILLLISAVSGGKIGEGDGICLLVCGLFVGITGAVQITEIALLLILPAGALLFMTRRFGAEDRLPFVPFLAAASTILMVCCRLGRL